MSHGVDSPSQTHADSHVMQCMEVWGGNQAFDSSLVLPGLDAWVFSQPFGKAAVGGDVYYVSSCATGRITRLLVADVTGHGSAVSELATGLRTLMRRFVNYIDQGRFVREMNAQFAELSKAGKFATAVVTTFYAPTRRLSVCNAGHPPPLIYRAADRQWSYLERSRPEDATADTPIANLPLGILDLADYDVFDTELAIGDLVLCYTDSLVESFDEEGKMLGQAGLLKEMQSLSAAEAEKSDVVGNGASDAAVTHDPQASAPSAAGSITVPVEPLLTPDVATIVPRLLAHIRSLYPGNLDADDVTALLFRANGQASTQPLSERLKAPFRIAKAMVRSLTHKDEPIPWPEASVANLGGAVIPSLSKTKD